MSPPNRLYGPTNSAEPSPFEAFRQGNVSVMGAIQSLGLRKSGSCSMWMTIQRMHVTRDSRVVLEGQVRVLPQATRSNDPTTGTKSLHISPPSLSRAIRTEASESPALTCVQAPCRTPVLRPPPLFDLTHFHLCSSPLSYGGRESLLFIVTPAQPLSPSVERLPAAQGFHHAVVEPRCRLITE